MSNYNEMKSDLSRMGFDVYPGCRNSAIQQAIEEWGISLDEIIGKLSDTDVLEAIHASAGVMGLIPDEEEEVEEEDEDAEDDEEDDENHHEYDHE